MAYSFGEHTADVRMVITGKSDEEVFKEALLGMVNFLEPQYKNLDGAQSKNIIRKIEIESIDKISLLVDFLNQSLTLMQIEKEAYEDVGILKMEEKFLNVELLGSKIISFKRDIKAITYHRAKIEKLGKEGIRAEVIFDI